MKRIMVANDLVGIGKVGLSASIPVMAACCMEQALLPTCLLSGHTGGGNKPVKWGTSDLMKAFLTEWRERDADYHAIVVGYLSQTEDAEKILDFLSQQQVPLILDPIMADQGKLYTGFTSQHVAVMTQLAGQADLLIPNVSEACLLTQTPYLGTHYSEENVKQLVIKLASLGPRHIVISGISFQEGEIGFAYYQSSKNHLSYYFGTQFPQQFYGTGDIVSAIIASGFCYELPMKDVLNLAISFIEKALQTTLMLKEDISFGIAYEPHLAYLNTSFQQLMEENK